MSICHPGNRDRKSPEEHHRLDCFFVRLSQAKPGSDIDVLALKGFRNLFDSWQAGAKLLEQGILESVQLVRGHTIECCFEACIYRIR
jgi:hypothetical protein